MLCNFSISVMEYFIWFISLLKSDIIRTCSKRNSSSSSSNIVSISNQAIIPLKQTWRRMDRAYFSFWSSRIFPSKSSCICCAFLSASTCCSANRSATTWNFFLSSAICFSRSSTFLFNSKFTAGEGGSTRSDGIEGSAIPSSISEYAPSVICNNGGKRYAGNNFHVPFKSQKRLQLSNFDTKNVSFLSGWNVEH